MNKLPVLDGLSTRDYQAALDVQSACNLSGVVRSFADIMPKIWDEARKQGKGTEWVNNHPICRLFAEQIAFLAGGMGYSQAHKDCKECSVGD
jgi:hypothetical protein